MNPVHNELRLDDMRANIGAVLGMVPRLSPVGFVYRVSDDTFGLVTRSNIGQTLTEWPGRWDTGPQAVQLQHLHNVLSSLKEATHANVYSPLKGGIALEYQSYQVSLHPQATEEPFIQIDVHSVHVGVKRGYLRQLLQSVRYATTTHDTRYVGGLVLEVRENVLRAQATDSRRMAIASCAAQIGDMPTSRSVCLARATVSGLLNFLAEDERLDESMVFLGFHRSLLFVSFANQQAVFYALADAVAPNLDAFIPPQPLAWQVSVDKEDALRALAFADKHKDIKTDRVIVTIAPGELVIESPDSRSVVTALTSTTRRFAMSAKYLIQAMKAVSGDVVSLGGGDTSPQVMINGIGMGDVDVVHIAMPMAIPKEA